LIPESVFGVAIADEKNRTHWIEDVHRHGERGD
jgi:hypothetical protein